MHFSYENPTQFAETYEKELELKGYSDIKYILPKIYEEIEVRKKHQEESLKRKLFIEKNYKSLYSNLSSLSDEFFDDRFLNIWRIANSYSPTLENLSKYLRNHKERLYSFPLFNHKFCDNLVEELKHFENSSLPKGRPNTMNKYGINLSELGFDPFFDQLRIKYLMPITRILYPDWGGGELDSHKAFIVTYKVGEDIDLSYHYDNAEVTLNISLNNNYTDGELYFGPMRYDDSSMRFGYEHEKGYGLLHLGQQMHGALPISQGERYNLIIWMRSSAIRNKVCPMCDSSPSLIPVLHGTGDGFTESRVDFCTAL